MPRNKVLEKAKVTMPSGRNAFDMSQERSQTSLCGEIDVCYAQPFVAGTKGHLNRENFTRTASVVSPAFHRVTEHFDFFIVPIHSLWSQWENYKLNINDLKNTLTVPWNSTGNAPDLNLPTNVPRMDYNRLGMKLGYFVPSATESTVVSNVRSLNNVIRICDWLRLGSKLPANNDFAVSYAKVMSILLPLSYQKAYYEHYRKSDYEPNNPYCYNADWLYDGVHNGLLSPTGTQSTVGSTQDDFVAREIFKVRNVNYRNDYFHNIYPGLNYILPAGGQPVGIWSLPSSVAGVAVAGYGSGYNPYLSSIDPTTQNSPTIVSGSSPSRGVSVQQIRAIFALDRLMRAAAYAPKHVREQYKAQYGVDGVEDFDMSSERIGSFQSSVQFQEVTSMADANSSLGSLGAKGLGAGGKDNGIDFYCKYDSIVIGLHYFLPRARYDSYGVHPWNTKISREAFYIRAFENLGLRPFYSNYIDEGPSRTPSQIGWTVANFEYKILPDLNFGPFKLNYDDVSVYQDENNQWLPLINHFTNSELSTFVPHSDNPLVLQGGYLSAEYFKVRPEHLDNVFASSVPATHTISHYQFFTDMRIICSIVAPMGVHGQPIM